MNASKVHLLDMPDEILLRILKKLNNMDVLHSLLDNNNGRLNILAREKSFSDILKFVYIDDAGFIDRFCNDILPKIQHNVKCFHVDSAHMERILLTANYPNLTDLEIVYFQEELASKYFTSESPLRSIFQEQITSLTLVQTDHHERIESLENYTTDVYGTILNFFKNLKHLSVDGPWFPSYPGLSLSNLPSTTFSSSILTQLHINVNTLDDCLYLLDGRLNQLTTLSVNIYSIDSSLPIINNMDNLLNLKCFSLKSFFQFWQYDRVTTLLRRMSYLEKLTLYLSIKSRDKVIDDIDIQNDILQYMPQLYSFTFYVCTFLFTDGSPMVLSCEDIQQTLINMKQKHVTSIVNYVTPSSVYCSIFSLPFAFDYLLQLGNTFPDVIFSHVTVLWMQDMNPFQHEFFIRISRSFPLLKELIIMNCKGQVPYVFSKTYSSDNSQSYSIIKYPHLTKLDVSCAHRDYIEQFLSERKAYVPCLTDLSVDYFQLCVVTNNLKREDTRQNCATIKRLITTGPIHFRTNLSVYFPLLIM